MSSFESDEALNTSSSLMRDSFCMNAISSSFSIFLYCTFLALKKVSQAVLNLFQISFDWLEGENPEFFHSSCSLINSFPTVCQSVLFCRLSAFSQIANLFSKIRLLVSFFCL